MTLIIGDAIEVMETMRDDEFGAVVTSPPYNIGVDYGEGVRDDMSDEAYDAFTAAWVQQALRVAPVACINFGTPTSRPANLARFMLAVDQVACIQSHIVWVKSISSENWSYGHFKPVNSKRYLTSVHESVFIVSRDGNYNLDRLAVGVPFKDKSNIERFSNAGDVRCRGNVWYVPYKTRTQRSTHPATYPLSLAKMMIQIVGTPPSVLDPFAGSGTTGIAADQLGVGYVGIDIRPWP